MGMSVRRAQLEISSMEFVEWMAYESLEPGDPYRSDARSALIACTIANTTRTKSSRPYKVQDFMLDFNVPEKKSSSSIKVKLESWLAMYKKGRKKNG